MKYEHPLFDFTSQKVKKKIKELQGLDNLYFAGAYQGYGFHEDGLSSALSVVRMINNAD
jgi:predicted NAD/FAD-binding protein